MLYGSEIGLKLEGHEIGVKMDNGVASGVVDDGLLAADDGSGDQIWTILLRNVIVVS